MRRIVTTTLLVVVSTCLITSSAIAAGEPEMSPEARKIPHDRSVFRPDPTYADKPYDSEAQLAIYGGKSAVKTQRPLLEIGRALYTEGTYDKGINLLGENNLFNPHLIVYGDWRTAVGWNDVGGVEQWTLATRLNLEVDMKLTATERIHGFIRPLDKNGRFTRWDFGGENEGYEEELDGDFETLVQTLFFEGDIGAMLAGLTGEYNHIDLPVTAGLIPMLTQNGVWLEDAFGGVAFAIPAFNSTALDISNADLTFFWGFDRINSRAITNADGTFVEDDVNLYGMAGFIDTLEGYIEVGYGYVDTDIDDLSYHNFTLAFTRRYGGWLSNSTRLFFNVGQDPIDGRDETADGFLVIFENSLITHKPLTLVPYFNFFASFDRVESLARDPGAGGILRNVGLNFETDGLTGFPTLDANANDTYGGAIGVQYLFNLDKQLVLEVAGLNTIGDDIVDGRDARGHQIAVGLRAQYPLNNAWLLRVNGMYGWLENAEDIAGGTLEARFKF